MDIVVSPYHLTTREAPAMGALHLAARVITMMPTPAAGTTRRHISGAVAAAPKYLDLMESWRWSAPLWEAGVITPTHDGLDAADDIRGTFGRIAGDERYAPLRPLMRPHLFDDDREYLQAVAADVLKGGPDPAISVPVAAGLDRFAARHRLTVARAAPTSLSQRAEERLGQRLGAVAMPMLVQASADRLILLREDLASEIEALREAFEHVADGGEARTLESAARAYAVSFEAHRQEFRDPLDPDELRPIEAMFAVALIRLPAGAVLESSVEAARAVGLARGAARRRASGAAPTGATLPALWDADSSPVLTLVFRQMGRR